MNRETTTRQLFMLEIRKDTQSAFS